MRFSYSDHWIKKKKYRDTITESDIEYSMLKSPIIKDKRWKNVFNAVSKVPPSGRTLKVVYKRKGNVYKRLTTYWLD